MSSTLWLVIAVVIVMVGGGVGTIMIGRSQSNREESSEYSKNSGKIWANLTGIYVAGIIIVALLLIWLIK